MSNFAICYLQNIFCHLPSKTKFQLDFYIQSFLKVNCCDRPVTDHQNKFESFLKIAKRINRCKSYITYVMLCAIWYHLYDLKIVKNPHGGVLLLVKLQALACNFTKSNTPPQEYSCYLNCTNGTKIEKNIIYMPTKFILTKRVQMHKLNLGVVSKFHF